MWGCGLDTSGFGQGLVVQAHVSKVVKLQVLWIVGTDGLTYWLLAFWKGLFSIEYCNTFSFCKLGQLYLFLPLVWQMDFSKLYPKVLQIVKCVTICVLCKQDTTCVCDLFWPLFIELFFMYNWPSFSEFPLHFQVLRGPDFSWTVYLNSLVFRDHNHEPRIFHHKTVSNLHALNIFSHSPFHVKSFCVHCNCKKYCTHQAICHWCIFTLFLVGKNSCWKGFA